MLKTQANVTINDDNLINAMVANPILIERPIAVSGNKAIILNSTVARDNSETCD